MQVVVRWPHEKHGPHEKAVTVGNLLSESRRSTVSTAGREAAGRAEETAAAGGERVGEEGGTDSSSERSESESGPKARARVLAPRPGRFASGEGGPEVLSRPRLVAIGCSSAGSGRQRFAVTVTDTDTVTQTQEIDRRQAYSYAKTPIQQDFRSLHSLHSAPFNHKQSQSSNNNFNKSFNSFRFHFILARLKIKFLSFLHFSQCERSHTIELFFFIHFISMI